VYVALAGLSDDADAAEEEQISHEEGAQQGRSHRRAVARTAAARMRAPHMSPVRHDPKKSNEHIEQHDHTRGCTGSAPTSGCAPGEGLLLYRLARDRSR
jgi:hypothetical protein